MSDSVSRIVDVLIINSAEYAAGAVLGQWPAGGPQSSHDQIASVQTLATMVGSTGTVTGAHLHRLLDSVRAVYTARLFELDDLCVDVDAAWASR